MTLRPCRPPEPGDPPRLVAWLALRLAERDSAIGAQEILDRLALRAGLQPRDRALAFELMQGILRERFSLDAAIDRLEGFQNSRASTPHLHDVIRLGACQHFRLTRIPPHAIVHATVEVARQRLGPAATRFANAALQQLVRQYPARAEDYQKLLAALPLEKRHSIPGWLGRELRRTFGPDPEGRLLAAINRPLPLYARVNPMQTTPDEAVKQLAACQIPARTRPDLAALCIQIDATATAATTTPLFLSGGFTLQDPSAQRVAELLDPRPGMTVIDFCAAPGGKTIALATAMRAEGKLYACDISKARLMRLRENVERFRLQDFVRVLPIPPDPDSDTESPLSTLRNQADRVLVDAPCSGLGTLRRHPEIRWRVNPAQLRRLAEIQNRILDRAAPLVRPGGILVYATCSFSPQENDHVVAAFLDRNEGRFQMESACESTRSEAPEKAPWLRTHPLLDDADSACAIRLLRIS